MALLVYPLFLCKRHLALRGKILEFKKEILKNHTLEAVLSMPDALFFNSNVGVVSCIMIFTAHKQHSESKETFFGYYKDDGFVKGKTQGRYDAYEKWGDIKERWVSNFQNKKSVPGFSVNKLVTAKDEWCAEAYMLTDYKSLAKEDFINTLLHYSTFLFSNKLADIVSADSVIDEKVELEIDEWNLFKLDTELFEITGSKTTSIFELEAHGEGPYPYITTQATNNGTGGFYNYHTEVGNVIHS